MVRVNNLANDSVADQAKPGVEPFQIANSVDLFKCDRTPFSGALPKAFDNGFSINGLTDNMPVLQMKGSPYDDRMPVLQSKGDRYDDNMPVLRPGDSFLMNGSKPVVKGDSDFGSCDKKPAVKAEPDFLLFDKMPYVQDLGIPEAVARGPVRPDLGIPEAVARGPVRPDLGIPEAVARGPVRPDLGITDDVRGLQPRSGMGNADRPVNTPDWTAPEWISPEWAAPEAKSDAFRQVPEDTTRVAPDEDVAAPRGDTPAALPLEGKSILELDANINPRLGCALAVSSALHELDPSFPVTNNNKQLSQYLKSHGYEAVPQNGAIQSENLQPGDVLIGQRPAGMPGHSAIYKGQGKTFENNSDTGTISGDGSLDTFNQKMHDKAGRWNKNGFSDTVVYRKVPMSGASNY